MDLGDIITDDKGYTWSVVKTNHVQGWAVYRDDEHTSSSPLVISSGNTAELENNAAIVIDQYLPVGVTSFYNEALYKITPENVGDYYIITFRFIASVNSNSGYFTFGIDIGGSLGVRFKELFVFPKGQNVAHDFSIDIPCYTLDTFVTNGGIPTIIADSGDLRIWDIELQVARISKG
jgi:hypothetical protein